MNRMIGMAAVLLGIGAGVASAGTVGWRNDGTGRFPGVTAPLHWDKAEGVVWKTATPKWSNASPILVGDRIFICAEPDSLLCLDKLTGAVLWQRSNSYADIAPEADREAIAKKMALVGEHDKRIGALQGKLRQLEKTAKEKPDDAETLAAIATNKAEQLLVREERKAVQDYALPSAHGANGFTSCTPTTDGTRIFVFFGNGVAAAYDLEGKRLWARIVEKPTEGWGHSASPVLSEGRLVIQVRDIHGLDAASGETVWKVKSRPRWGAGVGAVIDGQGVVITASGEIIRAKDGFVVASGLHGLEYCAPLVHEGVVYFIENGGKAFRLPAKADGVEKPELLWQTAPPKERYYASPLYHDGALYCINQHRVYSIIDAKNGEVLKSETIKNLRGTVYPSVTLAGGYICLGAEGGSVVLLEPGVEMKEVAVSTLGSFRSCPVFEKDRVYIRTLDAMLCIRP
jgi:outer membrane protein assembly factor BamB